MFAFVKQFGVFYSKLEPTAWVFMQMEEIRRDIRDFKEKSGVDKVIVLWTANTERFSDVVTGVNDTAKNLLATIQVTDNV